MKTRSRKILIMLLAPTLILFTATLRQIRIVNSHSDPVGKIAFQRLSHQIKVNPHRQIYRLTRISNYRNHFIAIVLREDRVGMDWSKYDIVYNRKEQELEELGVNLSQRWSKVTDEAIHAVATEAGTYKDLAKYGCKNIHS